MKTIISILISVVILLIGHSANAETLIIGGKNFTENQLLARMSTILLNQAGITTKDRFNVLTKDLRPALINGKVHLYWEYTGTAISIHLKQYAPNALPTDAEKLYTLVRQLDAEHNQVLWLNRSTLNNSFVLAVPKALAEERNLWKLSDLKNHPDLIYAAHAYFPNRHDGMRRMFAHYGHKYHRNKVIIRGHDAIPAALKRGLVQVGMLYGTDAFKIDLNLVELKDDKGFFPKYNAAPTLLQSTAKRFPILVEVLNQIGPWIDHETMTKLNFEVDVKKRSIDEVAMEFLQSKGVQL